MAVYIAGISALQPNRQLKRHIRRVGGVRAFIRHLVQRDTRLDLFMRTNKMFSAAVYGMPSKIGINSLYWPVGAGRFGVGVFLVSESQASLIFSIAAALSNKNYLMTDFVSSTTPGGTQSNCFTLQPPDSGQPAKPPGSLPEGNEILTANQQMKDYEAKFNLMPIPVAFTQRSIKFRPFDKQSYFATYLIPLVYVPIIESDNITDRTAYLKDDVDGCGLLLMVDQRFVWQFTPVPNEFVFLPNSNDCYFTWYRLVYLLCKLYLMPFQYEKEELDKYGRLLFYQFFEPSITNDTDPCKLSVKKRERKFDDDRAYFGVPNDAFSFGLPYSLAEWFAIIEQSLSKKMLFHPNWQIEFVNPLNARFRMLRNLLLFTPRVVFDNKKLREELGWTEIEDQHKFAHEFPIIGGGLADSISKTVLEEYTPGPFGVRPKPERLQENPEPRHLMFVPHVIEVVGHKWESADTEKDNPDINEDAGSLKPFGHVYYRACLVPQDKARIADPNTVEFPEEEKYFYKLDNKIYTWSYSAFLPGSHLSTEQKAILDYSVYRIMTSHLCLINTKPDTSGEEVSDPKEESKYHVNRPVSVRLGRLIVRDWLAWYAFPFTWEFGAMNYWPLTGYEDYIVFKSNGRVRIVGHQSKMISMKTGTKYVGWESPWMNYNDEQQHILLDDTAHADGSGEGPNDGGIVSVSPGG
ncbi:MAG: hypothetical protein QXU32_11120 [Nitrososphaerales archaeon]